MILGVIFNLDQTLVDLSKVVTLCDQRRRTDEYNWLNDISFGIYKKTKFIYKYLKAYNKIILKVPKGEPILKVDDLVEFFKEGT